jgi:hypothetical protein
VTTWLPLAPYLLAAVLVFFLPGLAVGWAGGVRGFRLAATAPLWSAAVIALGAIAAGLLGLRWTVWTALGATVLAVLLVVAADRLGRRRWPARTLPEGVSADGPRAAELAYWPALALAAVALSATTVKILGRPAAFSSNYDNLFHLNAIRWILDTGQASSLTLQRMTVPDGGFYPAAWHDLAATVALTLGSANVPYACNAAIWVLAGLVWPAGCLLLARTLIGPDRVVAVLGAGLLTAGFCSAPFLLLGWGTLYPNSLGLAFLPAALAWAASLLGLGARPDRPLPPLTVFGLTGAGLGGVCLAHPNSLLSLLALGSPLLVGWAAHGLVTRRAAERPPSVWRYLVPAAGGLGVAAAIWLLLRPDAPEFVGTTQPMEQSIGEALTLSPLFFDPAWLLGLLLAAGLVLACRRLRLAWLPLAFAVATWLWVAASAMPPRRLRSLLVGGYFADQYRLAALLPVAAYPLVVLAWSRLVDAVAPALTRSRALGAAAGLLGLGALAWGVLDALPVQQTVEYVSQFYRTPADSSVVDADEYALIERLPELVPEGVRVATDPWTGAGLAYALTGVETTTTHVLYAPDADEAIIDQQLNRVAAEPDVVCPALAARDVEYALDFGDTYVSPPLVPLAGFADLADAPGFEEVAREGDAVLYKITACA